ncbi:hypothetical protein BCR33DRAFT_749847 [Rhizoclosmatium globosum]|uniref:Uncharacterized protein n=1 Tax=Rhizoclosmatium globosum TaxID=329046 RepID=A0A1Y2AF07_9FUNG|nr:hypothetical protein BCR33DRAFT_749847 [Rhizoclosmatium globosum]|eukprot:ORY21151.1 hypothetical protein BCR33DRAFT_749847 [Rhizoclosmatium globosum]
MNGGVERPLGVERERAFLFVYCSNLTMKFFTFAMEYSLEVGHCVVYTGTGEIPYELLYGKEVDESKLKRLYTFGCLGACFVDKKIRKQLGIPKGQKAEPCLFLGYSKTGMKRVYKFRTKAVHEELHVRFLNRILPGTTLHPHHMNPYMNLNASLENDPEWKQLDEFEVVESVESVQMELPPAIPDKSDPQQAEIRFEGEVKLSGSRDKETPIVVFDTPDRDSDVDQTQLDDSDEDDNDHEPINESILEDQSGEPDSSADNSQIKDRLRQRKPVNYADIARGQVEREPNNLSISVDQLETEKYQDYLEKLEGLMALYASLTSIDNGNEPTSSTTADEEIQDENHTVTQQSW